MKPQNLCASFFAATFFLASQSANAQSNGNMGNATIDITRENHYKPWSRIMEKDIDRKRRVWEEISMKTEQNRASAFYAYNFQAPLLDVLIKGVTEDKIKAYSNENDRFTRELTKDEFATAFGQTTAKNTEIVKYLVKEDSLYTNTGEITVRILGIAPVAVVKAADGTVKEQALFWIFYPDARAYLASVPVSGADGWYDIFDKRSYTGMITKLSDPRWADSRASHK